MPDSKKAILLIVSTLEAIYYQVRFQIQTQFFPKQVDMTMTSWNKKPKKKNMLEKDSKRGNFRTINENGINIISLRTIHTMVEMVV